MKKSLENFALSMVGIILVGLLWAIVSGTVARELPSPVKTWEAPDLRRFMAVAQEDGYSPLWLLAAHTGMRQGELLGLRWQDVDLERGVAHVVQAVPTVRGGAQFTQPKTASGRRTSISRLPATCASSASCDSRLASGRFRCCGSCVRCAPPYRRTSAFQPSSSVTGRGWARRAVSSPATT